MKKSRDNAYYTLKRVETKVRSVENRVDALWIMSIVTVGVAFVTLIKVW